MDTLTLIGIAVGLSMDALAVSVANGMMIKCLQFRQAFLIAFAFGFFQFLMPIIGWTLGLSFVAFIARFDHWIAFVLLVGLGSKMLYEAHKLEEGEELQCCTHLPTLFTMAVATSIDALAVGLSFACLRVSILYPVLVIGIITFVVCLIGIYAGKRFGHLFEDKLEYLGGAVLILIGFKILLEHLVRLL